MSERVLGIEHPNTIQEYVSCQLYEPPPSNPLCPPYLHVGSFVS